MKIVMENSGNRVIINQGARGKYEAQGYQRCGGADEVAELKDAGHDPTGAQMKRAVAGPAEPGGDLKAETQGDPIDPPAVELCKGDQRETVFVDSPRYNELISDGWTECEKPD